MAILNIIGNTSFSGGSALSGSTPQPAPFIATGGIKTNFQSGSFIYTSHTFTSSGVITITEGQKLVDILLIGGGGGGRSGSVVGVGGEGGGAGGYLLASNILLTTASAQIPYITASFNIAVGNGGAQNQNGTTSSISASYTYSGMPSYPIIAYGGGAGSGSGASGGGQANSNQPTQGKNGGFRNTGSNDNYDNIYYSAPGGGSYLANGGSATTNGHTDWRVTFISGSSNYSGQNTGQLANVSLAFNYQGISASVPDSYRFYTAPSAPYAGGYPIPYCADYPGYAYRSIECVAVSVQNCGGFITASSQFSMSFADQRRANNVLFRGLASALSSSVSLEYKDSGSADWFLYMTGSYSASLGTNLTQAPPYYVATTYECPQVYGPITPSGSTRPLVNTQFNEGFNTAGQGGVSVSNTLIDGTDKYYSGGGNGGAWSGELSGSLYVQDYVASVQVNAGQGGYSGSLNGTNAAANSGCGGGGGAVNNVAALRGTGGSGGSGVVVITYISGSAI